VTPEQEEAVRRALGALGHEGAESSATPPAVVARLDAALEDLVAPRRPAAGTGSTQPAGRNGDQLASRRRRRSLVLAAAASVVVLAGTGAVVRGLGQSASQDSSASGASAAKSAPAPGDEAQNSARGTGSPRSLASNQPGTSLPETSLPETSLPETSLHRATLGRDVQRLLARRPEVLTRAGSAGTCTRPALARGDRLAAVRLDGRPAVLVVGAGRPAARVYACQRPTAPVASARIPGR
jgi:hypothetical protein